MAWNPQGGGPWGGGSGGGGGGNGNWGRGPSGGPQPADLEEFLRKSQDRFKRFMPGGFGTSRGIILLVLAAAALWLATGMFRVQPGEMGVTLLFGEYRDRHGPGLHWWFPAPIGEVLKPNVERINQITIGYRGTVDGGRAGAVQDVPEESLMLTGDQNIIDADFIVQWRIKDAGDFLFNLRDPVSTIKVASESAMREVVGQAPLEFTLSQQRESIEGKAQTLLQQMLDDYGTGVLITDVKLQRTDPPSEVIDAFNDVQRAKQDQERKVNEATAYRNDVVPRAKGGAEKMIQDANAYREKLIKEAEGEAKRFLLVYEAFRKGRDVATTRLFLERMQDVLSKADKVIVDGKAGVVPYLPLPEVHKRAAGAGGAQ